MASAAAVTSQPSAPASLLEKKLSKGPGRAGVLVFGVVLLIGVLYAGWSLVNDLSGVRATSILPYLLLGFALLVALADEMSIFKLLSKVPGLGTMVGWKRIVVTVGEKIGKNHLTYAQGAAAEITAMATIGAADGFGLPVSTTHVLSSGVAGTMAANQSGLQWGTVRNLLMA